MNRQGFDQVIFIGANRLGFARRRRMCVNVAFAAFADDEYEKLSRNLCHVAVIQALAIKGHEDQLMGLLQTLRD